MNQKIGILDSGIGGTTVLKEIKKLLPKEDYIYYADSKNNPYGEKAEMQIIKIVDDIVEFLIKEKKCKMIVIACNTATTKCMNHLKEKYQNIPIIGTVPAIKVACDNNYKNTLVLATPQTIDSLRTKELITKYKKKDQEITLFPCPHLAHAIETGQKEKIMTILTNIKKEIKNKKIDSIVLGCTHYPLITKELNEVFPNIPLLDGSLGVAKEVKRKLESNHLINKNGTGTVEFIQSKEKAVVNSVK